MAALRSASRQYDKIEKQLEDAEEEKDKRIRNLKGDLPSAKTQLTIRYNDLRMKWANQNVSTFPKWIQNLPNGPEKDAILKAVKLQKQAVGKAIDLREAQAQKALEEEYKQKIEDTEVRFKSLAENLNALLKKAEEKFEAAKKKREKEDQDEKDKKIKEERAKDKEYVNGLNALDKRLDLLVPTDILTGSFKRYSIDSRPFDYSFSRAYEAKPGWVHNVKDIKSYTAAKDGQLFVRVEYEEDDPDWRKSCKCCPRCSWSETGQSGGVSLLNRSWQYIGTTEKVKKGDKFILRIWDLKYCAESDWGVAAHVMPACQYLVKIYILTDEALQSEVPGTKGITEKRAASPSPETVRPAPHPSPAKPAGPSPGDTWKKVFSYKYKQLSHK